MKKFILPDGTECSSIGEARDKMARMRGYIDYEHERLENPREVPAKAQQQLFEYLQRQQVDAEKKSACKTEADLKKEYLAGNREVEFTRTGGFI